MTKERIAIVVLAFTSSMAIFAGYEIGVRDARSTDETMHFLLVSDNDLDAVQNIKLLEGLKNNKIEEAIKFTEVRVKASLEYDGISESTIQKAQSYQSKHCRDDCLISSEE